MSSPKPSGKPIIESVRDIALVRQAMREGWQPTGDVKQQVCNELHAMLDSSKPHVCLSAVRALIEGEAANLYDQETAILAKLGKKRRGRPRGSKNRSKLVAP